MAKAAIKEKTRLVKVLAQLLRGLQVIGITKERAWELVEKTALDSMPALRQKVVLAMLETDVDTVTSALATQLGYPTVTTRRALEDLTCYGIINRESKGTGNADLWSLTDWTRKTYQAATRTLSEIREGDNTSLINNSNDRKRISDKVPGDDISDYPTLPCPKCGSDWLLTPDCKGYVCDKGHIYKGGDKNDKINNS